MRLVQIITAIKNASLQIKQEREKDVVDELKIKEATIFVKSLIKKLKEASETENGDNPSELINALDSDTLQIIIEKFTTETEGYTDTKGDITLFFFHLCAKGNIHEAIMDKFSNDWTKLALTLLNDSHPWVIENSISALSFLTKTKAYQEKMLPEFLAHNGIARLLTLRENSKESPNNTLKYCLVIILTQLLTNFDEYATIIPESGLQEAQQTQLEQFIIDSPKELINYLKNDPGLLARCQVSLLLALLAEHEINHEAIIQAFTEENGQALADLNEYITGADLDPTIKRNIAFLLMGLVKNAANHLQMNEEPNNYWKKLLVKLSEDVAISDMKVRIEEALMTLSWLREFEDNFVQPGIFVGSFGGLVFTTVESDKKQNDANTSEKDTEQTYTR